MATYRPSGRDDHTFTQMLLRGVHEGLAYMIFTTGWWRQERLQD